MPYCVRSFDSICMLCGWLGTWGCPAERAVVEAHAWLRLCKPELPRLFSYLKVEILDSIFLLNEKRLNGREEKQVSRYRNKTWEI
ncbi:hypothetical protein MA16_Dca021030 [Dendrobium catenatum]|uniref:Uncharacterized protein n=1 Tax=Dendrobium catenatum TaxID=906689 RepID=A0A2I0W5I5_9ASPA|nr:hypothetical protein MA16_Dca021030 [Dendrobium catenatum]